MGKIVRILGACLLAAGLLSCTKDGNFDRSDAAPVSEKEAPEAASRATMKPHGKVMLLYSAGFHNLSGDQKKNIAELEEGYLPLKLRNDNVLLAFARNTAPRSDYGNPVSPVLIRLYRTPEGGAVRDTVKTWPKETLAADPETFHEVLSYVRDQYPAESYGVVFSSHGTGWLPKGYYDNAANYDVWNAPRPFRSIGMDVTGTGFKQVITEMEVDEMAAAIPSDMKLDYFLFDACLMGCVEVAYAFKDKVNVMGFSPSEVLSYGFDYTKMASFLLEGESADPISVCRTYLEKYLSMSGSSKSACTAVVDLRYLDEVADACTVLFEKYRSEIAAVKRTEESVVSDGQQVSRFSPQNYYTGNHRWFYDLRDILVTAGVPKEELADLDAALAKAVLFEGHTPNFLIYTKFQFHSCCGMSMFLPSDNTDQNLEDYYRKLSWNVATGLIP